MFSLLWDPLDDHASPVYRHLVEILDKLVALAVDPRRPQRARVQTLSTFHLDRRQNHNLVLGNQKGRHIKTVLKGIFVCAIFIINSRSSDLVATAKPRGDDLAFCGRVAQEILS